MASRVDADLRSAIVGGSLEAVRAALHAGISDLVPSMILAQCCILYDGKRMAPEAILDALCEVRGLHRGDLVADVLAGPAPQSCHVAMRLHVQFDMPVQPRYLAVAAAHGYTGLLGFYISQLRRSGELGAALPAALLAAAGQPECAALLRGAAPSV